MFKKIEIMLLGIIATSLLVIAGCLLYISLNWHPYIPDQVSTIPRTVQCECKCPYETKPPVVKEEKEPTPPPAPEKQKSEWRGHGTNRPLPPVVIPTPPIEKSTSSIQKPAIEAPPVEVSPPPVKKVGDWMTCKAPTPPPKQVTEKKALLVLRALSQEEKDYIARVAPNLVITIDQVKKDPQLQKILDKALAQGAVTMTPPPSSTQTQQR